MSRLDDLIAQLCPDGVENVQMGEITEIRSGWGFPINEQGNKEGDFPFYKVSDMNLPGNSRYMQYANNYVSKETTRKLGYKPAPVGTTIFPKIGQAIGTNKKRLLNQEACYDNNVVGIIPGKAINPNFLYYYLESQELLKFADFSGALPSIRKTTLEAHILPFPPLPVQEEIVRILDKFTILEAELEAELAAREMQYHYYRDDLLDFNPHKPQRAPGSSHLSHLLQTLCPEGVNHYELGEISTSMFRGSGITREQVRDSGTPCVRYGEIYTTYGIYFRQCVSFTDPNLIMNKKIFGHGDLLFAITGESVEEIAKSTVYLGNEKCLAGGDIVVMKHNQNPMYLAYALSTTDAQNQKSKGKVKSKVVHSSVPSLQKIEIPVPPLPVQQEIVRILDRFDALVHNLQSGLPAEIAARHKQYEYYRDQLLTFQPKPPLQRGSESAANNNPVNPLSRGGPRA